MAISRNNIDVKRTVKTILAETLDIDPSKIREKSLLIEDLGIDSFGFAELSFIVQEKFGFEISNEDAQNIKTVGNLISYMQDRTKGA